MPNSRTPAEVEAIVARVHDEQHRRYEARLDRIEERLDTGSAKFDELQERLAENTVITREVRDLLELGKAGLRILGHIGAVAKWIAGVAAAIGAVWALWHGGKP